MSNKKTMNELRNDSGYMSQTLLAFSSHEITNYTVAEGGRDSQPRRDARS